MVVCPRKQMTQLSLKNYTPVIIMFNRINAGLMLYFAWSKIITMSSVSLMYIFIAFGIVYHIYNLIIEMEYICITAGSGRIMTTLSSPLHLKFLLT